MKHECSGGGPVSRSATLRFADSHRILITRCLNKGYSIRMKYQGRYPECLTASVRSPILTSRRGTRMLCSPFSAVIRRTYPVPMTCIHTWRGTHQGRLVRRRTARTPTGSQTHQPRPTHPDILPAPGHSRCHSFEEEFVEQMRAMGARSRSRDLHDIVNLFRRPAFLAERRPGGRGPIAEMRAPEISVPSGESIQTSPMFSELESD